MTEQEWRDDAASPLSVNGPRVPLPRSELPEVLELASQGWVLAHEAPIWVFLPAVFPRTHRTWLHDRSTWYFEEWVDGVPQPPRPLPSDDVADVQRVYADHAARCGFVDWDASRIWMLRGGNGLTVDQIIERIVRATRHNDAGPTPSPRLGRIAADIVASSLDPGAVRPK
jgi:hypothetical protein